MLKGNQPTDGGNFILSPTQRRELLRTSPEAAAFVRKLYGSKEMIDCIDRYCIWIEDDQASLARKIAQISRRLDGVTLARLQSTAESTRERADHAHRFIQMQDYGKRAIAVPEVSSEKRERLMPLLPVRSTCCKSGAGGLRRCRARNGMRHAGYGGG